MKLIELLSSTQKLTVSNNLSTPYIVGGLPRDKILGISLSNVKDIDITTGDEGSSILATLLNKEYPETSFRLYDDGHTSVSFKNISFDFSNNFKIPGIEAELKKMNEEPTELKKELFSRDFTINTLLQPLDLNEEVLDLTKMALPDIRLKVIKTPINPELTIGHDIRRILRAIKLAIRFDFTIDRELEDTIIKFRGNLQNLSMAHIKKQVNQMLKLNPDKTLELLSKYKLLSIIPLSKMMQTEVVKRNMVQDLID